MSVLQVVGKIIGKGSGKVLVVPILLASLIALFGAPAFAEFPDKTVHVIVHTSPGGGVDTMARLAFKHAGRLSGANFVVENFAGAGG